MYFNTRSSRSNCQLKPVKSKAGKDFSSSFHYNPDTTKSTPRNRIFVETDPTEYEPNSLAIVWVQDCACGAYEIKYFYVHIIDLEYLANLDRWNLDKELRRRDSYKLSPKSLQREYLHTVPKLIAIAAAEAFGGHE